MSNASPTLKIKLPLHRKVVRELKKIPKQVRTIVPRLLSGALGARYYDLVLARQVTSYPGAVPVGSQLAVLVLFPNGDVPRSTYEALRMLQSKGYATVVVSNAPLSPGDIASLRALSHKVILRPNFGYDFAAYREGILALAPHFAPETKLVLLNDSVWFPVGKDSDWIKAAESLGADMVGAVSNYGCPRKLELNDGEVVWDYRSDRPKFHYCSFALMLGGRLLTDPRFMKFWKTLGLTNDKALTIERGEIGFSQWVISNGFSHASTFDPTDLKDQLLALDRSELDDVLLNLVIPENPQLRDEKRALLKNLHGLSTTEVLNFILLNVKASGAAYALPAFAIPRGVFPFLKKSPLWLDRDSSDLTLRLADQFDQGNGLAEEARAIRQMRAPQFGPVTIPVPARGKRKPIKPVASQSEDRAA